MESRSPSRYSYRMLFDLNSGNVKSQKRDVFVGTESKEFSILAAVRIHNYSILLQNIAEMFFVQKVDEINCLPANASQLQNSSCSVIQFTRSDYDILNETSIFIYASNKTYRDVTFANGLALVCIDIRGSVQQSQRTDPIEGWLSFVCGIVSLACLLLTLVVYMIP